MNYDWQIIRHSRADQIVECMGLAASLVPLWILVVPTTEIKNCQIIGWMDGIKMVGPLETDGSTV